MFKNLFGIVLILGITMEFVNSKGIFDKLGLGDKLGNMDPILDKNGGNAMQDFKPNTRKCVEMEEGRFCYQCEFRLEGVRPAWQCECDSEELDKKATGNGDTGHTLPLPTAAIRDCFGKLTNKEEL